MKNILKSQQRLNFTPCLLKLVLHVAAVQLNKALMATEAEVEDTIKNYLKYADDRKGGRNSREKKRSSDINNCDDDDDHDDDDDACENFSF